MHDAVNQRENKWELTLLQPLSFRMELMGCSYCPVLFNTCRNVKLHFSPSRLQRVLWLLLPFLLHVLPQLSACFPRLHRAERHQSASPPPSVCPRPPSRRPTMEAEALQLLSSIHQSLRLFNLQRRHHGDGCRPGIHCLFCWYLWE